MSSMRQRFIVNHQHHCQVQCQPENHCQQHVVSGAGERGQLGIKKKVEENEKKLKKKRTEE